MVAVSFPLHKFSNVYFTGLDESLKFISIMLFYSVLILGSALMVFSFMTYRVERVRARRLAEDADDD